MGRQGDCVLKWVFMRTFLGNQDATLKYVNVSAQFCMILLLFEVMSESLKRVVDFNFTVTL